MESKKESWRDRVKEYFFLSHLSISDISALTGISRQSISAYLKKMPEYQEEREKRKTVNADARKEYKREKNRTYRADSVTSETMRREHDVAAVILSREKYY